MARMANTPRAAFADSRGNSAEHTLTNQHQSYMEASRVTTGARPATVILRRLQNNFTPYASALFYNVRVDSGQMRNWRQARTSTKPTMTTSIHPSEDIPHPQLPKSIIIRSNGFYNCAKSAENPAYIDTTASATPHTSCILEHCQNGYQRYSSRYLRCKWNLST